MTDLTRNRLKNFEPIKVLSSISAFQLIPSNYEKIAMIEFAAASYLSIPKRGKEDPPISDIKKFLSVVGSVFKDSLKNVRVDPLAISFIGQYEYTRHIGSPLQKIEATLRRFKIHESFIKQKLGFSVDEALFFVVEIMKTIMDRMDKAPHPPSISLSKSQFYDLSFYVPPSKKLIDYWSRAISFTESELKDLFPSKLQVSFQNYLAKMTLDINEGVAFDSTNTLSANPLWSRPLVRINSKYLIPFPPYLLNCLSRRFHEELTYDQTYGGKYMAQKGGVAESWVADLMSRIFPEDQTHRNVRYDKAHGFPDADLVIEYGDFLLFFECTTRWLSEDTMKGDLESIRKDLDVSIRKCYNQARRAIKAFGDGKFKLLLKGTPTKFVIIIVTDTLYPNLTMDLQHGTYVKSVVGQDEYPYIISIFDLDDITNVVDANLFLKFVQERLELFHHPHIICMDEVDYLRLYLKPEYKQLKNSILEKKANLVYRGRGEILPTLDTSSLLDSIINQDKFAVFKVCGLPVEEAPKVVMGILYAVYGDWKTVLRHVIFNLEGYYELVNSYRAQGEKCKAIGWEGMEEYLKKFSGKEGKEFYERLIGEGLDDVKIVVTCDTNMYQDLVKKLKLDKT